MSRTTHRYLLDVRNYTREIAGFVRDSHRVRTDMVWQAVEKLPELQAAVEVIPPELEQPGEAE